MAKTPKKSATTAKTQMADAAQEPTIEFIKDLVDEIQSPVEDAVDDRSPAPVAAPIDELENTSPLSAKILTGLTLMVLGGGVALWGGPKIAPNLPAGMKPVADFLAPGSNTARAEVESLRSELDTKLAALATTEPDTAQLDAFKTQTNATLEQLQSTVASNDTAPLQERLTGLEGQVGDLSGSLEKLTQQLADIDVTESVETATAAKIAGYAATISKLEQQINNLSQQQGSLNQKISTVSDASDRKIQEAETKVASIAMQKALADIASALDTGDGFQPALDQLTASGLQKIPDGLVAVAATGAPTLPDLQTGFANAAHSAIKADVKSQSSDGIGDALKNFFRSQITLRSTEPQEGDSTDAILSRVQGHLDAGDVAQAVAQADALTGAGKQSLIEWIKTARVRAQADTAYKTLATVLSK